MGAPLVSNFFRARADGGQEQERAAETGAVVEQQRRQQHGADRIFVPQRVGGNEQTRHQPVAHPGDGGAAAQHVRPAGDGEDAGNDEQRADHCQPRRALAQQQHRADHGEQRPCAARQRVDHGEVAVPVAALEHEKVRQVDGGATEHEEQGEPTQRRAPDDHVDDDDRRPEHHRQQGEKPGEWDTAARTFGQQIPQRVQQRGGQDEQQGKGGQRSHHGEWQASASTGSAGSSTSCQPVRAGRIPSLYRSRRKVGLGPWRVVKKITARMCNAAQPAPPASRMLGAEKPSCWGRGLWYR